MYSCEHIGMFFYFYKHEECFMFRRNFVKIFCFKMKVFIEQKSLLWNIDLGHVRSGVWYFIRDKKWRL